MDISQLLTVGGLAGAIGGAIGTAMATLIQEWLTNDARIKERNFQEKKEAYTGFLEAGHESETRQTPESVMKWTYWKTRCELVCSQVILKLLKRILETNPVNGTIHPERFQVMENLLMAMRKDLGVQK